jgi:hypothetical protein
MQTRLSCDDDALNSDPSFNVLNLESIRHKRTRIYGDICIAAGEDSDDFEAEFGRGFLRWRESDEEAEEARCKGISATCDWKKEKSPKEETSSIWDAGPWALNQER